MYATGIGLVLYGLEHEEDLERENTDIPNEEPEAEAAQEQTYTMPPVFDQMPPMPDETVFARYNEAEQPQTSSVDFEQVSGKDKKGEKKSKRNKSFGKGFTNAIEAYFNKVFNDSTIKNEGEE
jgi:hypothetical protein